MSIRDNLIGRRLIKKGCITEEQLQECLNLQKNEEERDKRRLIGEILVAKNYCSEEDIAETLSEIFHVAYISTGVQMAEDVEGLLPPELMERYQAVPLWIENNRLVVAMKNLKDIVTMENIHVMTGYKVQPVVVRNSDLKNLINKALNPEKDDVGEIMNKLEVDEENPEEEVDDDVVDTSADSDKPVIELANLIFEQAAKTGASDVHIDPTSKGVSVLFRIDGVLHKIMECPRKLRSTLISRIKVLADMDIAEHRKPQDGRITINVKGRILDIRAASLPTQYGEKLTLRVVDRNSQLLTLEDLGFSGPAMEAFKRMVTLPYGFILVAGPTGSGKSTTLYATLIHINDPGKHTVTIEDPIERRVEGLNQVQVNRQAGLLFSTGLRALMRNDPDIIMVGEIRDRETAQIAVEAALTGHLVLSTIHTNDAAGAVTRLVEMGIEPFLVASSLVGVVAQRLVRVLCRKCKRPIRMTREEILRCASDFPLKEDEKEVTIYEPVGCDNCHHTGYKGRIGVYELLSVTEEVREAILDHLPDSQIKKIALKQGMVTMRQDGLMKVKDGITSLQELMRVVR